LQLISMLKSRLDIQPSVTTPAPQAGKKITNIRVVDQRELTEQHRLFIDQLIADYENFVPTSKRNATEHQKYFVDQRRPFHLIKEIKDLHFQISYQQKNIVNLIKDTLLIV